MTHTKDEIQTKAGEVRLCLLAATAALNDPEALEAVARFALANPEIAWEPVAIAAAASNAKRDLDRAAGRDPLAEAVSLPPESATSAAAVAGTVFLPLPRRFI